MPDRSDPTGPLRATPRGVRRGAARRIGPYRVEGELGRGGMGVVDRAFDERLHRDVALKALPKGLVGDREQLAELEREARAVALVSHPNVATIFGMERAAGATYLVLELVSGETLRERLGRGALPCDEALAPCAQVAAGLEAVHRKGLVHRDLKPSNVMVTPDGVAKLLDFGLARRAREEARRELTHRGEVIGTPGWMSPEQLRGEGLDARSDAWAWGCLLFECVAGAPAFPGATGEERGARTLEELTDVRELQERLMAAGIGVTTKADESSTDPACFMVVDPRRQSDPRRSARARAGEVTSGAACRAPARRPRGALPRARGSRGGAVGNFLPGPCSTSSRRSPTSGGPGAARCPCSMLCCASHS
jgi:serine/threonine protein kinase